MSQRFAITILCIGCQIAPLYADEPKHKPIDAETIAAYEKLGAKYGGFKTNEIGHPIFSEGANAAEKGLPGFRYYGISFQNDKLPSLTSVAVPFGLEFYGPNITDAGLKELKELKNLVHLSIHVWSDITDTGLKELKDFKNLKSFELDTVVSDSGLKQLKEAKNLTHLSLMGSQVTDRGLKQLKEAKNLTSLNLAFTIVTDEGAKELQKALPNCLIVTSSSLFR